jgi:dephospho-CoA kinase
MIKKRVIGIVGGPGTGKDTVVHLLAQMINQKVEKFSFSKVLIEEYCTRLGILPTHPNLQYIGDAIRPEWLHVRAREYIQKSDAAYIVIPSIRRQADLDFIKTFPEALLLGVITDDDVAHTRMRNRKEKIGEEHLTREEYQTIKNNVINQEIPSLLGQVSSIIENTGTVEELKEKLREIIYA